MRNTVLRATLCAALCAMLFSQALFSDEYSAGESAAVSRGAVVLIPHMVYVGDKAVMRYTFSAPADSLLGGIFGNASLTNGTETALLPFDAGFFESCGISVTKMSFSRRTISRTQSEFTLELAFIPWKTGMISIPPVDIMGKESLGEIQIPPFGILSLVETLGETDLRPAIPPRAIPGTTHLLILSIASVPLAALLALAITRGKAVSRLLAPLKLSRGARAALKRIKKLRKYIDTADGAECAREISSLLREYLTKRFVSPYIAFTPDETALNLSVEVEETWENMPDEPLPDVSALLKRCEFIRFAPDSIFPLDERGRMLETSREVIIYFDARSA